MAGEPVQASVSSTERVVAAAIELFDEVGYSAATIEDIRERSGVSVGSIYHRFGSKEGIAAELYLESLRDFQGALLAFLRGRPAAAEGIRGGVGLHLRWIDANRARARFLMRRRETEVVRVTQPDVELLNKAVFTAMDEWYRPLAVAGEIRELALPLLYAVWFGPAQEYSRFALELPDPKLFDAEPALADAAWAALRP
jgi:AcrR family transcriptional regulator